jgi:hypothetical protein
VDIALPREPDDSANFRGAHRDRDISTTARYLEQKLN